MERSKLGSFFNQGLYNLGVSHSPGIVHATAHGLGVTGPSEMGRPDDARR